MIQNLQEAYLEILIWAHVASVEVPPHKQCQINSVCIYFIGLDFVHQVAEGWQAAETDHGLTLLWGQTFHFG